MFSSFHRFNSVVKRCRVTDDAGSKMLGSNNRPLMCRNNELYAMHQRQLQLRKEQQQQKNLTASSSPLTCSTGILLGSSVQNASINSPACGVGGNTSSTGGTLASVAAGSGSDAGASGAPAESVGGFNMLSPAEMSLDYQVESPMDSKAGIIGAEDEGGGATGSSAIGETKSLLTSKGLQPSFNDLDNLFDDNMMGGCDDNSNDESVGTKGRLAKERAL